VAPASPGSLSKSSPQRGSPAPGRAAQLPGWGTYSLLIDPLHDNCFWAIRRYSTQDIHTQTSYKFDQPAVIHEQGGKGSEQHEVTKKFRTRWHQSTKNLPSTRYFQALPSTETFKTLV
jgi:hypothetical protein